MGKWPIKKLRENDFADNPINILHRYFIWANRMRIYFDYVLQKHRKGKIDEHRFGIESMMYMSLWYGLLFVVIEGWQSLKLSDPTVDELLKSSNVALLKKYRNAIFHYPEKPKYNDKRFENFFHEQTTVQWVRQLNSEFSHYFLNALKK